ncbi:MAG: flagellar basal body P-ring protein FlgI [Pirellulales bacterium]
MMISRFFIAGCVFLTLVAPVEARTRLKNICRIKGQEEIELVGQGLVVGLNGTGEANDPITMEFLARAIEILGRSKTQNAQQQQQPGLQELRKVKNVAMVMVSASIPATGARRGDRLDCYVSAINGKSLQGGRLLFVSLKGPNTQDDRVFASCEGQLTIDDPEQPMGGVVVGGCQMKEDVFTPFQQNGCITLLLDKNHANFQTAAQIAGEIERKMGYSDNVEAKQNIDMVHAKDATNIIVRIPQEYLDDPVDFASNLLDTPIDEHEPEARVVINSRAGSIVISGDLEIGDVIVSHKNVTVEAGVGEGVFSSLDMDKSNQARLQDLIDQLNALRIPTADMIEIIRGIDKNGKLHGKLILD